MSASAAALSRPETSKLLAELTAASISNDIANSIQIVSDIHLEFGSDPPPIKRKSPILALLGDIGYPERSHYRSFILSMARQFEAVLLIAGNHEFYSKDSTDIDCMRTVIIPNVVDEVNRLCGSTKVHFLDNASIELPSIISGVRLIGSTLWVDYPANARSLRFADKVSDLRKITIVFLRTLFDWLIYHV